MACVGVLYVYTCRFDRLLAGGTRSLFVAQLYTHMLPYHDRPYQAIAMHHTCSHAMPCHARISVGWHLACHAMMLGGPTMSTWGLVPHCRGLLHHGMPAAARLVSMKTSNVKKELGYMSTSTETKNKGAALVSVTAGSDSGCERCPRSLAGGGAHTSRASSPIGFVCIDE